VQGLKLYLKIPFIPKRTFASITDSISNRVYWEVLIFHVLILAGLNFLYFMDRPFYSTNQEISAFVIGFLIGVFGRIVVLAYLIMLVVNRAFKIKISFTESVNYVLLSLLPLLTGVLSPFFSLKDYGTFLWIGIIYSSILIAYGINITKKVDLIRMLILIVCCHLLLFAFRAPFLGFTF